MGRTEGGGLAHGVREPQGGPSEGVVVTLVVSMRIRPAHHDGIPYGLARQTLQVAGHPVVVSLTHLRGVLKVCRHGDQDEEALPPVWGNARVGLGRGANVVGGVLGPGWSLEDGIEVAYPVTFQHEVVVGQSLHRMVET